MIRALLAILVALSTAALSINAASAKPSAPKDCTFEPDFATFRQAVGEDIVGDCEANRLVDKDGNAHQPTSEGTLSWDAKHNRVTFRDSWRFWMSGPAGIGTDVTIDGLSDRSTSREPVVAPAALMFDLASLEPDDLGPAWTYADVPQMMAGPLALACLPAVEDFTVGSVQSWLYDFEHERTAVHTLSALPARSGLQMRTGLEQFAAACDGWTDRSRRGTYVFHVTLDPFIEIGDDSLVLRVEIEHKEGGVRLSRQAGFVQYGELSSQVAVHQRAEETDDDIRPMLEWLASRAHGRIQHAAWYLRD